MEESAEHETGWLGNKTLIISSHCYDAAVTVIQYVNMFPATNVLYKRYWKVRPFKAQGRYDDDSERRGCELSNATPAKECSP